MNYLDDVYSYFHKRDVLINHFKPRVARLLAGTVWYGLHLAKTVAAISFSSKSRIRKAHFEAFLSLTWNFLALLETSCFLSKKITRKKRDRGQLLNYTLTPLFNSTYFFNEADSSNFPILSVFLHVYFKS